LVLGLRLTRFDIRATATTEIYTLSLHDALPIFEKWTRHAHTAVSHKATEVSRWFDSHPSGHDRALILSAAMLEGSSTDAVWEARSEEHTSELQSRENLVCRLLLEKKNIKHNMSV